MEIQSLSPATQAVLRAVAELEQANAHELAEKSGKARSTTDRAIKTLADAGLIVAVDPEADSDDGTPTRWALSEATADQLSPSDFTDEPIAGPDETEIDGTGDEPNSADIGQAEPNDHPADATEEDTTTDHTDHGQQPQAAVRNETVGAVRQTRPADRKVMAIKGVLAEFGDEGATLDQIVAESGISHPTTSRLLAAMEQADAARRLPGASGRWITGPTKASEVDPDPKPPRCPLCTQIIRGATTMPNVIATIQTLVHPDGNLLLVGPDGQVHTVALPKGTPLPTSRTPDTVTRPNDGPANSDGSQPLGRGDLERLTLAVLEANPGKPLTPQDIATVIGTQLGRTVSSGAVRNNCTKLGAAGRILLVSESPLTFVFPAPEASTATDGAEPHDAGQDGSVAQTAGDVEQT
ncbi:MarR family winged helix-turn-helix transcriptional regulator [Actinoplanes sp. NBC_00393]|uniref:MarR family transcriptional regulator n=1 Tax=Actinoplanes sp. NBC_00393 TaxID=2975953 RepID=UPI002E1BBE3F